MCYGFHCLSFIPADVQLLWSFYVVILIKIGATYHVFHHILPTSVNFKILA